MRNIRKARVLALLMVITFILNIGANSLTMGELQTNTVTTQTIDSIDRSNWEYTNLELISEGMTSNSFYADMVVDSQQNVHVVWQDNTDYLGSGTDGAILYKKFIATTQTWSGIYFISDECLLSSLRPSVTLDSQDNLHVCWEDTDNYDSSGTDKDIMYRRLDASTQLWQTTEVVSTESTSNSYDPQIVVDSNDNVHIAWTDLTNYDSEGTDYDIFYKYKSGTTGSWITTQVVSASHAMNSNNPSLDVDSARNVHIVWNDGTDVLSSGVDIDIIYKKYYPGTDTWSSVEVVSTTSDDFSLAPSILLDDEDNIHVCWEDSANIQGSGSDQDIVYRCYFDSLGVWGSIHVVSVESGSSSYPGISGKSIALDSQGNVYVTWFDGYYGDSGSWNAVYKMLDTETMVWSNGEVCSLGSTGQSRWPTIVLDHADHIYFVWNEDSDLLGAGTDDDIFFRKFAGPPNQPFLEQIIPNPTGSKSVNLSWSAVPGAVSYTVYRDEFYIYDVEGMTSYATTTSSFYNETLGVKGVYYYVVVAENSLGASQPSNCVFVEYVLPRLIENLLVGGITLVVTVLVVVIIISINNSKMKKKTTKKSKKK